VLGFLSHISRWIAWHTEGAVIGDPSRPDARITIVSTVETSGSDASG
jgi:hypothetical protein